MTFIILLRNPKNKKLWPIVEDFDEQYLENVIVEAHSAARKHPLCEAWGCEVIEVSDPT